MSYTLKSVDPSEAQYTAYGGALEFLYNHDPECIIHGPAETGKTLAACWKLHIIASKYDNAQLVIARKTQSSIYGSVLQTWERVIDGSPAAAYGGEKPQWYDYPNGSRVWLAGLDKASKVLSSERDIIYVNQAEELAASDWETLITRATGRGSVIPYPQLIGDANPSHAQHPLKIRSESGSLTFIQSKHIDNPTLYDPETGEITKQGIRTMAILDSLTGVRKDRLRYGLWTSAEGVIYGEYNFETHLIDDFIPDINGRYFLSVDFGFTNPFTASLWFVNNDGVAFLYKQIYHTKRIVEDHAKNIMKMIGPVKIEAIITDHDAEDRATLERYLGARTTAAYKSVTPGIEACKKRLTENRVYFMRGALQEIDRDLVDAKKPTCLIDEMPNYRWSDKKQDTPIKDDDHGCDDFRYFIAHLDDIGRKKTKIQTKASVQNYITSAEKKKELIPW